MIAIDSPPDIIGFTSKSSLADIKTILELPQRLCLSHKPRIVEHSCAIYPVVSCAVCYCPWQRCVAVAMCDVFPIWDPHLALLPQARAGCRTKNTLIIAESNQPRQQSCEIAEVESC